jgi:uncharacterized protein (TIGR02453 family)
MPRTTHSPNPFRPALFSFLRELEENNTRDWFQRNKHRYEDDVKEPALQFISDFGPHLKKISPHFQAIPKAVGGSLFRIYRDVRFSKDKSPYKTHVGIQFRHETARDAHAPGYYVHLQPGSVFVGAGLWHPDGPSLKKIRAHLVADASGWKRVTAGAAFRSGWALEGESLKRPPRGYDPDHALIEEIKRKDFIAVRRLTQRTVLAPDFPMELASLGREIAPFVRWLCAAVGVKF